MRREMETSPFFYLEVKMKVVLVSCFILLSQSVFALDKVIYGTDDRKDLYEVKNNLYRSLAQATAGMIPVDQVIPQSGDMFKVIGTRLQDDGICADAKFAKQITAANCSGFLVGEDLLVTAGHCIEDLADCSRYQWVFNYSIDNAQKNDFLVQKDDVYACTEIIEQTLDRTTMDDYALVRLDRKVIGHTPLKFRTSGKIANNAQLVVIGHPSGLPTKIADGAAVRENSNNFFFQSNLDTFGGNSGSAVFDANNGLVEGILVRGERDYVPDSRKNCSRPKVCKNNACRGEDVTRITNIKSLIK